MGLLAPVEIAEYLGLRPTWADGTGVGGSTWEFMVEHATAAILAGHVETVVLVYGSTARADLKARRRSANLSFGARGPVQFDVPFGHTLISKYAMADAPPHARVRHDDRAARRDRGVSTRYNAALQPRGVLPRPDHDRRRAERADDGRPAHQAALLHPQRRRRRGRAHDRGTGTRLREGAGVGARHRRGDEPHDDERVGGLHRVARRAQRHSSRSNAPA